MITKKNKSEKVLLQEGFLKNFLGAALTFGLIRGVQNHEIKRRYEVEKEKTKKQMKKDMELKRLLQRFSETSADLFSYVKRHRGKGEVYEALYQKLSSFY